MMVLKDSGKVEKIFSSDIKLDCFINNVYSSVEEFEIIYFISQQSSSHHRSSSSNIITTISNYFIIRLIENVMKK
jgi:hypothetical protein